MAKAVLLTKMDGRTDMVTVEFPASEIQQLANAGGDESRVYELFCDRPKGWAATLTEASRLKLFSLVSEAQVAWHQNYERFTLARMESIKSAVGPLENLIRKIS